MRGHLLTLAVLLASATPGETQDLIRIGTSAPHQSTAISIYGYENGVEVRAGNWGLVGVVGNSPAGVSAGTGLAGVTDSINGVGVEGSAESTAGVAGYSNTGRGVEGYSRSSYGVHGQSDSADGLFGEASADNKSGVYAVNDSSSGYAGYFRGRVHVNGQLSKASGGFKIDHPLEPEYKYLNHSFVESPDMLNIYSGNVMLDKDGNAWVELPEWFEALNRDFRYQLTPVGGFAQLYIGEKIAGDRFLISGGRAGLEVSWQVTGVRHDAWAEAHRIPVEEDKPLIEQGTYLHPLEWDQSSDRDVEWVHHPDVMQSDRKTDRRERREVGPPSLR